MIKKIISAAILLFMVCAPVFALRYSITTEVVSVGTSATKLPSTPTVGRKYVLIQNVGSNTVYVGDSNVTADETSTGGTQLGANDVWIAEYDHTVDIYGIVASGSENVVVEEGK